MTTLAKTATKSKAQRNTRTLRLTKSDNGPDVLSLTVGSDLDLYWLEKESSDYGDGWRLEKFAAMGGETYHVRLSDEGHTCTCKGWQYRGTCKHVDALVRMAELPTLSN